MQAQGMKTLSLVKGNQHFCFRYEVGSEAKVLDALEDALELSRGALGESRSVLKEYGNMSAATALFVLERMNWRRPGGRTLLSALGPGFSCAFQVLEPV